MIPTDETPVIFADRIQSLNYDGPDGGETFADAGTLIDLETGALTSVGIAWNAAGELSVRGDLTGSAFVLLEPGGTSPRAEWFSGTLGYDYAAGLRFYPTPATTPHTGEDVWYVLAGERTAVGTFNTFTTELRGTSQYSGTAGHDVLGVVGFGQVVNVETGNTILDLYAQSTKFGGAASGVERSASITLNSGAEDSGASSSVAIYGTTLTLASNAFSVPFASAFRAAIGLADVQSPTNSPPSGSVLLRSHTNGYIYAGWINTVSGSTSDTDRIYASGDQFLRYVTPATFRANVITPYYVNKSGDTMTDTLIISTTGTALQIGSGGSTANIYFNTSSDVQITHDNTQTIYGRNGANTTWCTIRAVLSDASSIRYKRDVVPVRFGMLAQARAIEPVTFRYRKLRGRGGDEGTGRMLGVIAEQVHRVAPDLTHWHTETGDVEGVSASGLATLAIGAVVELARQVDRLAERVAFLERSGE